MRRHIVETVTPQCHSGSLFSLLLFLAFVGAVVYLVTDPVGAAHLVKAVLSALVTFFETLFEGA